MSSDSRVEDMDNFTPTVHSKIPAQLEPSKTVLPHPFVVCVIGASSGIGEYIAYAYAEAGASGIVLSSRKIPDLHVVAQKVTSISPSIKIMVEACDIASASSVAALAEKVKSAFGRLDVLVPNSGFAGPVTLKVTEGSPDNFQQNFGVNCIGTYHAAHYFIPLLLSSTKGAKSLIVVGSFAACIKSGPIANTGYCLSKFAQSRLVEFIAEQYEREGLLAVCVHPGAVLTPSAAPNTPEVFLPCE